MKHRKTKAPSTRHPKTDSLRKLHGVQASSMLLSRGPIGGVILGPDDDDHPAQACAPDNDGDSGGGMGDTGGGTPT